MTTTINPSWLPQGTVSSSRRVPMFYRGPQWRDLKTIQKLKFGLLFLIIGWLIVSAVLQLFDPAAGILDIGILTVGIFGLLVGVAAILCSLWLQELLWQPFNAFRKNIHSHFNRLSSWQQCILYFSVFFLMLYAVIVAVGVAM